MRRLPLPSQLDQDGIETYAAFRETKNPSDSQLDQDGIETKIEVHNYFMAEARNWIRMGLKQDTPEFTYQILTNSQLDQDGIETLFVFLAEFSQFARNWIRMGLKRIGTSARA